MRIRAAARSSGRGLREYWKIDTSAVSEILVHDIF